MVAEGELELSSVVDKTPPGDYSLNLETGALTSGFLRDGRTLTGLGSPRNIITGMRSFQDGPPKLGSPQDGSRFNGKCAVDMQLMATPNGHCATGNTLPGGGGTKLRGTMNKDHVMRNDASTGRTGVESEATTTTGCFACIALCHGKQSRRKSSK